MDKPIPKDILDRIEWDTRRERENTVKRVRPIETQCDYCEKTVADRREWMRQYESKGVKHWRKKCVNCNLFWNPKTKKFDLTPYHSLAFFRQYIINNDK